MRDMKSRLLAIETELQALYRETGDESQVSVLQSLFSSVCDV